MSRKVHYNLNTGINITSVLVETEVCHYVGNLLFSIVVRSCIKCLHTSLSKSKKRVV